MTVFSPFALPLNTAAELLGERDFNPPWQEASHGGGGSGEERGENRLLWKIPALCLQAMVSAGRSEYRSLRPPAFSEGSGQPVCRTPVSFSFYQQGNAHLSINHKAAHGETRPLHRELLSEECGKGASDPAPLHPTPN